MRRLLLLGCTLLLASCLPAAEFRPAEPHEAALDIVRQADGRYAVVFQVGSSPAVCIDGADGSQACTTLYIDGANVTTDNPNCLPHPTLADVVRCVIPEPIETGYVVVVSSSSRVCANAGFFLAANPRQPLFLPTRCGEDD